ncbi:MAG: zinc-ribbon domain-containing protein [Alistipes sp.]|nr:zinc-ribbon domain-containing protein [Alistipes sp.]
MVTACERGAKPYAPSPILLDDVVLHSGINGLREAIAENAHEIWARNRMNEGWSYGPQRDDKLKQTPDMVPYAELSELEKNYDRNMAIDTIKLIYKLGYDIVKFHNTPLYAELRERLAHADKQDTCPRCGASMYDGQRYCDRCGEKIAK